MCDIVFQKHGGTNTKYANFVIALAAVLIVMFAVGCVSAPEKEAPNSTMASDNESLNPKTEPQVNETHSNERYVEVNLLDGTKLGGKYISETPAFTTIIVMYTIDPSAYTHDAYYNKVKDPEKYFIKGDGTELSIKNSLINSMVTIDEPTAMIEAALQEMNATAAAIEKAAKDKAEAYQIAKEQREAKQAS